MGVLLDARDRANRDLDTGEVNTGVVYGGWLAAIG
jgi:hypothetical protein